MLLTAFAAGISAFVGSAIGASALLMTLAALIWGVAGGLLVALGPNAGRAGLASMILLVVTAATPRPLPEALAAATLIFAGGLLQMLLAIAAWPLQRYRPERHALAALARQLAVSARKSADQAQPPPVTEALLDVESLLYGAHRARGDVMETFRVLAGVVERIRRELLAIGDLESTLEAGDARSTLARLREYTARALTALAEALERGESPLTAAAAMEGFDPLRRRWRSCAQKPPTVACNASSRSRSPEPTASRANRAQHCATRTSPAAAATCAPKRRNCDCRARCARAARWRHCARISRCRPSHSATRSVAAFVSPSPSRANERAACRTATGFR